MAIWRSTFSRQPSGCALTQINPRERRLMTCRDTEVESIRYSEKSDLSSEAARSIFRRPTRLIFRSLKGQGEQSFLF